MKRDTRLRIPTDGAGSSGVIQIKVGREKKPCKEESKRIAACAKAEQWQRT